MEHTVSSWRETENSCKHSYASAEGTLFWKGLGWGTEPLVRMGYVCVDLKKESVLMRGWGGLENCGG